MHDLYPAQRIRSAVDLRPAAAAEDPQETDESPKGSGDEASPQRARILVVEDEFLVGAVLVQDLRSGGYDVVGPYANLASAQAAVAAESFDLAILDINLRGEMVYPVAAELANRQIPFFFLSGYTATSVPDQFRSYVRLSKPVDSKVVLQRIKRLLARKLT